MSLVVGFAEANGWLAAEPWGRPAICPPLHRKRSSAMLDPLSSRPSAASAIHPVCNETMLKLYSYFRSSAAYRVGIALNLKGLRYEILPVHLTKAAGEQRRPEYRGINPQMRVPALVSCGEVAPPAVSRVHRVAKAPHPKRPAENFPTTAAAAPTCQKLPAFEQARPETQPAAE